MQIRISDMPAAGMTRADTLAPEHMPDLVSLTQEGACRFQGPIEVTLFISPVAGMFRVEGKLRAVVGLTCSRCLEAYDDTLASHFHVTYTRKSDDGDDQAMEDRELEAEDMGLVSFEGEEIDFRETLQEQVILALPMQPKCRPGCRGLCARCGANLNWEACTCGPEAVDPRLAVLKNLKLKE